MDCGLVLSAAPQREQRRVVTVVFSDLVGSTALGERLDPEAYRNVLTGYFKVVSSALERHGGVIEKYIGDAVMAVFGLDRTHEDDALRACRAAVDLQAALAALNVSFAATYGVRLTNRTGIHTGEVVAGDAASGQRLVTGDVVNTAARLEQACPELAVLLGQATFDLVRSEVEVEHVEPIAAKGKASLVQAYRLVAVSAVADRTAYSGGALLVGRRKESDLLASAWGAVRSGLGSRVVTLTGDPGMGKTRLIDEVLPAIQEEGWALRGRCLPYGEGITYWPLHSALRALVGAVGTDDGELVSDRLADLVEPSDRAAVGRLARGIGLTAGEGSNAETHAAAAQVLAALARRRPLAVVFDDLHWAEPTFLELLRSLAEELSAAPVLMIFGGRPEFVERPGWEAGPRAQSVSLDQLTPQSVSELVRQVLDGTVDAEVVDAVQQAAGGNPMFIGQMLALWVEQGLVQNGPAGWGLGGMSSPLVPPTIAAIVSARLDNLLIEDLNVARRAAVIGIEFSQAAVETLTPPAERGGVADSLNRLERARLVVAEPASDLVQQWSFSHVLIKDAAYARLTKHDRSLLHEQFAESLRNAGAGSGHEEVLAFHAEQAFLFARDLAVLDERLEFLRVRAVDALAASGRSAVRRGDLRAAPRWFERAITVTTGSDPVRASLLADLGSVLAENGERKRARGVLEEAVSLAEAAGDLSTRWRARRPLLELVATPSEMEAEARAQITVLEELADVAGLARAWRSICLAEWRRGHIELARDACTKGLAYAVAAGDVPEARDIRAALPSMTEDGATTVTEGLAIARHTLQAVGDNLRARGFVLLSLAGWSTMAGGVVAARRALQEADETLRDGGIKRWASQLAHAGARLEAAEGRFDRAATLLTSAISEGDLSTTSRRWLAAEAMHVLLDLGRLAEATGYEDLAGQTDQDQPYLWAPAALALARLSAARGDRRQWASHVRSVEDALEGTDLLTSRALLYERRAEGLRAFGDPSGARSDLLQALSLHRRKGDRVSARRVEATAHSWDLEVEDAPAGRAAD